VRLFRGGAYKAAHISVQLFKAGNCRGAEDSGEGRENYGFGIVTEAIDNESLDP